MFLRILLCAVCLLSVNSFALEHSREVNWTIGNESSQLDGGERSGPLTFTWKFNQSVEHGTYLDGTPFVIWQSGLKLISVSPEKKTEDLMFAEKDQGGAVLEDGIADATVINLKEAQLPLDQRTGKPDGNGTPWGGGADVWDEQPVALQPGDCIVTGDSRRGPRDSARHMMFNAIGVCNVVKQDMTGHYRPPIRMPRELRAELVTPTEVDVSSFNSFNIPSPKDWSGTPVSLALSGAPGAGADADDLLNGPMGNCGIDAHVLYENSNGTLNHNISGTDNAGYQRNVSDRFATCLYTAFDPGADLAKRQRSLNKFIQGGLDYYYMHCLGYPIWNGGGGHPNGVEGIITVTGALLGDAEMTDAIKYQRFKGDAVGQSGKVYDMMQGYQGDFSRSEALYTVSAADWNSGTFVNRTPGGSLDDLLVRMDLAREDMVANVRSVPFTSIETSVDKSIIQVGADFVWPMYIENCKSGGTPTTEARRSYRYIVGGVLRLDGEKDIRKIIDFTQPDGSAWSDRSWPQAEGKGGALVVSPGLDATSKSGTLTTGICTKEEAENDEIVLWESWPADSENRVLTSFFAAPHQDYLDNKLGDNFHWLPFYHLLDDPGAPGKKLYEENLTYDRVKHFVQMQRNAGSLLWDRFTGPTQYALPDTPTMQAFVRHFLLDDTMPLVPAKTYERSDKLWTDPAE